MDFIANWLVQGCVVAVTTAGVLRALRSARAPARYIVCWAGLSAVLLLPLVPLISSAVMLQVPGTAVGAPAPSPFVSVPHTPMSSALIMGAWVVWLSVYAVRLATAMRGIRRTRQRAHAFPVALERRLDHWTQLRRRGRPTELIVSDAIQAAAVIGCGSPVIAIAPALIQDLSAEELDRVVIHEWAHVQRRDDVANVCQLIARALAGWHPAVWWLDRRLRAERETACDEIAVALTGSSKAYAASLVKLAGMRFANRETISTLGILSSTSLATRVQRIVTSGRYASSGRSRGTVIAGIGVLVGVTCATGSLRLVETVVASSELDVTRTATQSTTPPVTSEAARAFVPAPVSSMRSSGLRKASTRRPTSRDTRRSTVATQSETPAITPAIDIPPERAQAPPVATTSADAPTTESTKAEVPADVASAETLPPAGSLPVPKIQGVTPWAAAANAGTSLGEQSKKGGIAAARFFSRFGKRIADSF